MTIAEHFVPWVAAGAVVLIGLAVVGMVVFVVWKYHTTGRPQ